MRLFLPPINVGDDDGFTDANDIFGRKPIGDGLTNLVTSVDQSLVIALDAQWGSGKTTFLKMWAGELRKLGIGVIYFDAFENDYLDDAFTAIAGQIISLAQNKHKEKEGAIRRFQEKAFIASKILARSALKIGVKLGTAGALKAKDFESAGKEIGAEVSNLTDKYLGENLTKQKEQRAAIEDFRAALAELPELFSLRDEGEAAESKISHPFVIIIDELDRCKPTFSLEILERIKHFFSVPNVHFVLGVHLGQLQNSIKATYGAEVDARLYLQKFITFPVMLIDPLNDNYESTLWHFCNYVIRKLEFPQDTGYLYAAFVAHVAHHRGFSLRTIEKIMTSITMTLAFSSPRTIRPASIIAGLAILRVAQPELFIRAKQGLLSYRDIVIPLALEETPAFKLSFDLQGFSHLWMYVTGAPMNDQLRGLVAAQFSNHYITDERRILPLIAGRVMDRFMPP